MLTTEIMDLVNELEEKFPVDQWLVDGIHVWPFIRIDFSFRLIFHYNFPANSNECRWPQGNLYKKTPFVVNEIKSIFKHLSAYVKDYKKNSLLKSKIEALFLSDGVSYSFLNNAWYEKFCDPFIDKFTLLDIGSLMLTQSHKYFIPRHTSSRFIQTCLDVIKIKTEFISNKAKPTSIFLPCFKNVVDFLQDKKIPVEIMTFDKIIINVNYLQNVALYFKTIFERVQPIVAFQVCYYSKEGMAFNLACRECGIPCVDIQHGVSGTLHSAYGRWNKIPPAGYELLPSIFWCWSNEDALAINAWNREVKQFHFPLVGGYLFQQKWLAPDDKMVTAYDNQIQRIRNGSNKHIHVLYTLSGYEKSEDLRRTFMTVCNQSAKIFLWVRLHPCYLGQRDVVKKILKDNKIRNTNLDQASDFPLYALLRNVDVHITECSSTVIEAEIFNVPSVILSDYGKEFYQDQFNSKWAILISAMDELIPAIQYQHVNKAVLKKREIHKVSYKEAFEHIVKLIQHRRESTIRQNSDK